MFHTIIVIVNVCLAGLLAGEELVIYFGVRVTLSVLKEQPQIQLRQALIRRLRILVPAIYLPTFASGIAVLFLNDGPGFGFLCAGVLALLVWILITLMGTVPINKNMLTWRPETPPSRWRTVIRRWEQLDMIRCWTALIAFACFLIAVGIQLASV